MTGSSLTDVALAYGPSAAYLVFICLALMLTGRVATWVHPALLCVGAVARVAVTGWVETLVTVGLAAVVFAVLVLVAGRTVSGVTVFTVAVALALTPFSGWPGLVAGLVVAALVATTRTWRHLGKNQVAWLAMDTMSAVGVSPGGGLRRPDLDLIPNRESLTDVSVTSEEASRLRMYLAPYLLLGVGIAGMFAYFG